MCLQAEFNGYLVVGYYRTHLMELRTFYVVKCPRPICPEFPKEGLMILEANNKGLKIGVVCEVWVKNIRIGQC